MNWKTTIPLLGFAAAGLSLRHYYKRGALSFAHPMKEPRSDEVRVACVGDSITYGYGVKPWPEASYPARLGALLGEGYCVNNFGFSGRTAGEHGDAPYTREKLFQKSLRFHPDIVVIMLGTNDTKTVNWNGSDPYIESLCRIIRAYKALPTKPRIFLASPPPAFSSRFTIHGELLRQELRPAVMAAAEKENVDFLDLFTVLDGHPEWFFDGVHPTADGAKVIAETVFHCIKEMER